jgi:GDP-L-fucose synthase
MTQKKVVITGGEGFLGKHLVKRFLHRGYEVQVPSHSTFDLRRRADVDEMYRTFRPGIVVHAAAVCGGIQACSARPGQFLYDNLVMGLELMDVAREYYIKKFVQISSVCAYPLNVSIPAKEEELWNGYPEETNAPYGVAKRVLITQAQSYRKQYGLNAISLIPVNMYGPGDEFGMARSHVISSLIRKCIEANKNGTDITVWGTGNASREFLYVEDCAEAVLQATEHYEGSEPINIGTGIETTIKEVVGHVVESTKFSGDVIWDMSKPEGQPRRMFDVSRAEKEFGFKAKVGIREGIAKTVEWYSKETQ